jgi:hypothetical protein
MEEHVPNHQPDMYDLWATLIWHSPTFIPRIFQIPTVPRYVVDQTASHYLYDGKLQYPTIDQTQSMVNKQKCQETKHKSPGVV